MPCMEDSIRDGKVLLQHTPTYRRIPVQNELDQQIPFL